MGYFDGDAESERLLHLWSLGIEEQFYIAWPLLPWLAWKRRIGSSESPPAVGSRQIRGSRAGASDRT